MQTTVVEEGGRGRGVIVAEPVVPATLDVTPASFSHSNLLVREEEKNKYGLDQNH
jgi:hypothetical protein